MNKFKQNMDFFRQPDAMEAKVAFEDRFRFDRSLDMFFKQFCRGIIKEIASGPVKRDISSYVQWYGKETIGFINYSEFKEIYATHVAPNIAAEEQALHQNEKKPFVEIPIEEGKLRALFGIFDSQSLGRVSSSDFTRIILSQHPNVTVFDRLKVKIKKGGERMINILMEEFQDADIPYGCQGQLPVQNFQTIMIDYDLPLMESDLKDLRSRAYIFTDKQNNEYVKYKDLLESFRSKNQDVPTISEINRLITRVQAQWRCYIAQKKYVKMREAKEFKGIGQTMNKLGAKGVTYADQQNDDRKGTAALGKKATTAEERKLEAEKKKKQMAQANKDKKKKSESLDARMANVVKGAKAPAKGDKPTEKELKQREDLVKFIKSTILEDIIHNAQCYAESLIVGRTIQENFENRPVTKFVFPMIQEF